MSPMPPIARVCRQATNTQAHKGPKFLLLSDTNSRGPLGHRSWNSYARRVRRCALCSGAIDTRYVVIVGLAILDCAIRIRSLRVRGLIQQLKLRAAFRRSVDVIACNGVVFRSRRIPIQLDSDGYSSTLQRNRKMVISKGIARDN